MLCPSLVHLEIATTALDSSIGTSQSHHLTKRKKLCRGTKQPHNVDAFRELQGAKTHAHHIPEKLGQYHYMLFLNIAVESM